MTPLYQAGAFDYTTGLVLATVVGVAFGFVLERAGFARADVLVAQFRGTDMRVLKVMFTAIVTTALGVALLSGVGALDLSLLVIPETVLAPQAIGGLLLGVGFVLSGYCPGTAVVALGSGYVDGLMTLVGVLLGSLLFGLAYPLIEGLTTAGDLGVVTFPELFGLPWAVVAVAVLAMAVGAFALGERLERHFSARAGVAPPAAGRRGRLGALGGLAGLAVAALLALLLPEARIQPVASPPLAALDPVTVATSLAGGGADLYLVDLRAPDDCAEATVPGAICLHPEDPEAAFLATLPPTRTLVLFGADDALVPPPAAAAYGGPIRRLAGGLAAFREAVLEPPAPPMDAAPETLRAHRLRAALHAHFTGAGAAPAPVAAPPAAPPTPRAPRKGGGC